MRTDPVRNAPFSEHLPGFLQLDCLQWREGRDFSELLQCFTCLFDDFLCVDDEFLVLQLQEVGNTTLLGTVESMQEDEHCEARENQDAPQHTTDRFRPGHFDNGHDQRRYLETKVNPVMERLVSALLVARPEDVASFMASWLKREYNLPDEPEVARLRQELAAIRGVSAPGRPGLTGQRSETNLSDVSGDEDDEEAPDTPVRKAKPNQRKAVSSEAYGKWNRKEDFVPRVIEKTPDQRGRILDKIGKAFMFSGLDPGEKEVVVKAMEERTVEAGHSVITQGEDGSELFVVDSGVLACTKVFERGGQPKFLKEYNSGESFGELALLYSAPRAATITAKTRSVLWVLDRSCFNNIVKDSAMRRRERYEDFLKRVPILSDMDPYERSQLADALKPAVFEASEYVIREGEMGDSFYIIEEGQAKATKVLRPGQAPEEVKAYRVGDYFGELALLRGEPRAANVIASTVLKCVSLDRHSFKRMLGPLEDILKRNASKYPGLIKD